MSDGRMGQSRRLIGRSFPRSAIHPRRFGPGTSSGLRLDPGVFLR
jgi:hypothetical protein